MNLTYSKSKLNSIKSYQVGNCGDAATPWWSKIPRRWVKRLRTTSCWPGSYLTTDSRPFASSFSGLYTTRMAKNKQNNTKSKWVLLWDMLLGAKSVCDTSQAWPWLFADRLAFFYGALDPTSRLGTRRKTDNVYDAQLEINARSGWKQETKIDTPKGWKRGYRCDSFDSVQFVPELTSHSREVCCRARVVHENPRKKAELPFILLLGVSFFQLCLRRYK